MNINEVIIEIEKFSSSIMSLGGPVSVNEIINFEKKYKLFLSMEYKVLLKKYNGIGLMGTNIYGIKEENKLFSLEECYLFEHYQVENKMPMYLVPFSPDGGGNHYCFDTRKDNEGVSPVVFWQHDYSYSQDDEPEVVNASLAEWIKEVMIDWTLEDYNYDGSSK